MDRETLLLFVEKIVHSGSREKAAISIKVLKKMLEEQGASESDIALIDKVCYCLPELYDMHDDCFLTEKDIEIAERRATVRKRREEEARLFGRC